MLSEMDDYFVHQTPDTFDHVATSDPRFQDRNYFNIHARDSFDTLLCMGLGNFPNTNVMDGYVILVHRGDQYMFRPSRELKHDRHRLEVGPFKMTIVEPWKNWRLALQPGDHKFAFDVTFTPRTEPYEHRTPIYKRVHGATIWHQIHVQQSCNYNGWIEVAGERVDVRGWWGTRDRSWGVRGPIRGAQPWAGFGGGAWKYLWMSAQFDDCAVHTWSTKMADGTAIHTGGAVVYTDGRVSAPFVQWDEELIAGDGDVPAAAVSTFVDSEGKVVRLEARRQTELFWAGQAMRDGEGFGFYRGEQYIEHDHWTAAELASKFPVPPRFGDSLCTFTWEGRRGCGVYESAVL
ncbi:MAG: hypothetical protein IT304_09100 [Dehalococcoidia bacterium]|nr:hypothetical protein [Dehalococcoidia bacterium]